MCIFEHSARDCRVGWRWWLGRLRRGASPHSGRRRLAGRPRDGRHPPGGGLRGAGHAKWIDTWRDGWSSRRHGLIIAAPWRRRHSRPSPTGTAVLWVDRRQRPATPGRGARPRRFSPRELRRQVASCSLAPRRRSRTGPRHPPATAVRAGRGGADPGRSARAPRCRCTWSASPASASAPWPGPFTWRDGRGQFLAHRERIRRRRAHRAAGRHGERCSSTASMQLSPPAQQRAARARSTRPAACARPTARRCASSPPTTGDLGDGAGRRPLLSRALLPH